LVNLGLSKVKEMNFNKQFLQIIVIAIFLSSCGSSTNKKNPINNLEKNINEISSPEKKRIEIRFSCGEDGISEYLNDGWNILKEDSQEKICTWKSVPATKDCDMEKDKGCKITQPDKIGEEKIYLLEK
jgi:pimeloyl-CoA synthetase